MGKNFKKNHKSGYILVFPQIRIIRRKGCRNKNPKKVSQMFNFEHLPSQVSGIRDERKMFTFAFLMEKILCKTDAESNIRGNS